MSETTPLTRAELHQTIEEFRKEQQKLHFLTRQPVTLPGSDIHIIITGLICTTILGVAAMMLTQ